METRSLFGHLVTRFATKPENLATESLTYILQKSPVARHAFVEFLRKNLKTNVPETLVFSQQVCGEDQSIPDLVGKSGNDEVVIVESKFWAGLTSNQPVSYLERLPKTSEAVSAFYSPTPQNRLFVARAHRAVQRAMLIDG